MDIAEIRSKPHLSASSIGSYLDCGLLYRFSRDKDIQPDFIPDALVFGTVIHKALEFYHTQRLGGLKPSCRDLINRFEELWTQAMKQSQNIKFKEGKDVQSLLLEGKSLLAAYAASYPETGLEVLALEEPFSLEIEGLPIPIIGIVDMIEQDEAGTIIVVDHKTTAKAYSNDEIDKNLQLTLYWMGIKANGFSDREILLRFDCLIKTKSAKFEQYYTTRGDEDERRVTKKILSVWDGIEKGVFVPNDGGWKCKGCLYRSHCDRWFLEKE
ncbi:MAG: PD-(D/E)XK nuclease family protein [Desulfovibrionaceae bacterium]|nr:PD-(D/E)XK nuclease family protein [Desulfovibrionaceae bacterium]